MDIEFISQAEAAALLRVTAQMVIYMVQEQKVLRRYRRGGKPCYKFADVLALRDARVGHMKTGRRSGKETLARRFAANPQDLVEVVG